MTRTHIQEVTDGAEKREQQRGDVILPGGDLERQVSAAGAPHTPWAARATRGTGHQWASLRVDGRGSCRDLPWPWAELGSDPGCASYQVGSFWADNLLVMYDCPTRLTHGDQMR